MFWLLLIAIHIPAMIGASRSLAATPDLFHIASLIALLLTVGCFVLKLAGFEFFPRSNARSRTLIFILIAALVHHEAAGTAAEKLIASPVPTVLATLLVYEVVRRSVHRLQTFKRKLATLLAMHLNEAYVQGTVTNFDLPGPLSVLASRHRIPRAPPA